MVPIESPPLVRRDDPSGPPPRRVQLRRTKGWRLPPNTVKVDRSTKWGNPFVVGNSGGAYSAKVMSRRHAWQLFFGMAMAAEDKHPLIRAELRGKNLACWCPLPTELYEEDCCHAAVLLEIANAPLDDGGAQQSPHTPPPQPIRPKESHPPTRPEEPTIHTEKNDAL